MARQIRDPFKLYSDSEHSKVWIVGRGTYVVNVPIDWGRSVLKTGDSEVYVSVSGHRLIITPLLRGAPRVASYSMDEEETDLAKKLEAIVISAYLNNYDGIQITLPRDKVEARKGMEFTQNRFYGSSHMYNPPSEPSKSETHMEYVITFNPVFPVEYNLQLLLRRGFDIYDRIYNIVQNEIKEYRKGQTDVEYIKQRIREQETESDKTLFYTKRVMNLAICNPSVLKESGVDKLGDVLHYHTIATALERLSDLESDIFDTLTKLDHKNSGQFLYDKKRLYDIFRYHELAHDIVKKSFEGDEKYCFDIIESYGRFKKDKQKFGELGYLDNFMSVEQYKSTFVFSHEHKDYAMLLRLVDQIEGIIGAGSNIAESRTTMLCSNYLKLQEASQAVKGQ